MQQTLKKNTANIKKKKSVAKSLSWGTFIQGDFSETTSTDDGKTSNWESTLCLTIWNVFKKY